VSEAFIRENYEQLSFSEEELLQKKIGILGTNFPPDWGDPAKLEKAVHESVSRSLRKELVVVQCCSSSFTILGNEPPLPKGDVQGFVSLGCDMENMWLMAQSLGKSDHIVSEFSGDTVEE
jgi:hypothetical protein